MAIPENLIELNSQEELEKLVNANKSSVVVLDFWASFVPACNQMNDVFVELARKHTALKFVKIEAEKFPEVSESLEIVAVPVFVVLKNGKSAARVEGANAPKLSEVVEKYSKIAESTTTLFTGQSTSKAADSSTSSTATSKGDLNTRLKTLINSAPVLVFIKGTPSQPRCGFSRQIIDILNENKVKFSSFNILADEEIRQGLKTYSNWPTYPQLYVNGELVGGLDIVKELVALGEFQSMVPKEKDLNERLQELTTHADVVVFIKGVPNAPRCGFSKQLVNILDQKNIKYEHFDILTDEEVRQGLKTFANWPTYPMVFHKGELIGGLDIIKELDDTGELPKMTGTLILASLGVVLNFINAWRFSGMASERLGTVYSALATYYLVISVICAVGFIGVSKKKINYVRLFAYYYWCELFLGFILSIVFSVLAFHFDKDICQKVIEQPDVDIDFDTCMKMYVQTVSSLIILLGLTCLIEFHFCLAVWAYYQTLRAECGDLSAVANVYYSSIPAYAVIPPPSYDSIPAATAKRPPPSD
ncbi:10892_t:CDS:10 [Ambispora gerdemannii]|uniref:10892_t:CDS:1 n=1 Tax=Ambispora gerdemannii TaxID=144530 RepID=A0A9N8YQ79_9GLOM|nr:10892_t:CDS:10 [Ambispora gerdemannii]